jgi:uncharacterized protein (DUF1684 family)
MKLLGISALLVLILAGCVTSPDPITPESIAWHRWRGRRLASVGGTNGWSTLVGLQWLEEGTNWVDQPGSAAGRRLGAVVRHGAEARFVPASGVLLHREDGSPAAGPLRSDRDGKAKPDVLVSGTLRFFLIARGERLGIRFKDSESPARRAFRGLEYYPYQPSWRLEGRFERFPEPRRVEIFDVTGNRKLEPLMGLIRIEVEGQKTVHLEALWDEEDQEYFILFRDRTSGRTTYGSGRFLHVAKEDAEGRVVVDFNYAYNPPCAFSAFATCPIPPRSQWLPFAVPAGEQASGEAH